KKIRRYRQQPIIASAWFSGEPIRYLLLHHKYDCFNPRVLPKETQDNVRSDVVRNVSDNLGALILTTTREQQFFEWHLQEVRFHDLHILRTREGDAQALGQHRIEFNCEKMAGTLGEQMGKSAASWPDLHHVRLPRVA